MVLYRLFVLLEGLAEGHVDVFRLLQVLLALLPVTVRCTLALLQVSRSFLFGCVALAFKRSYSVIFNFVVKLKLKFFVVAEVPHRAVRDIIDLIKAVRY